MILYFIILLFVLGMLLETQSFVACVKGEAWEGMFRATAVWIILFITMAYLLKIHPPI